jgi:hypothetical protein
MRHITPIITALLLGACATSQLPVGTPASTATQPQAGAGAAQGQSGSGSNQASAECQAAKLLPAAPLPVSLIPESVLRKAQSGWVTVRYDVVAGKAKNAVVVASEPVGLYDAYALRYANAYTEPTGATISGCVMHTNIKF